MVRDSFSQLLVSIEQLDSTTNAFNGTVLLVREPWSTTGTSEIIDEIRRYIRVKKFRHDGVVQEFELADLIGETLAREDSVLLEIESDLSIDLVNLIHQVHFNHAVEIEDPKTRSTFTTPLPAHVRLIVCVERDFIESRLSYHHFFSLFGSVVSI